MQIAVYVSGYDEAHAAIKAGCDLIYFEPDPPEQGAAGWCRKTRDHDREYTGSHHLIVSEVSRLCSRFPEKIVWKWPLIADPGFIDFAIGNLGDSGTRAFTVS